MIDVMSKKRSRIKKVCLFAGWNATENINQNYAKADQFSGTIRCYSESLQAMIV